MKDKMVEIIEILDIAYGRTYNNLFNQLIAQKIVDAIDEKLIAKRVWEEFRDYVTEKPIPIQYAFDIFPSWLEGRE